MLSHYPQKLQQVKGASNAPALTPDKQWHQATPVPRMKLSNLLYVPGAATILTWSAPLLSSGASWTEYCCEAE